MKQKLKKSNGITLIALVITIVILIILAGVLINITMGNGGIIERAKTAKQKQQIEQYRELIELTRAEVATENNGEITLGNLAAKLREKTDWVNSVNSDNLADGYIEVTTNDGYKFKVTATETKYEGDDGEVVSTLSITINASPSSQTTAVQNIANIAITVDSSDNITGNVGNYIWKEGESAGVSESDTWEPLSLTKASDKQCTAALSSISQPTNGDYYLFIKATINSKKVTKRFGPYKFQAAPVQDDIICQGDGTTADDNTKLVIRVGSRKEFTNWTLTYSINDGTPVTLTQGESNATNINVVKGDKITVTYSNGSQEVSKDLFADDIKQAYTLEYSATGATNVPATVVKYVNTITVAAAPEKDGFAFTKWTTGSDGTGDSYNPGDTITINNSERKITLYAQWRGLTAEDISYTATWDGSDGNIQTVKDALDYLYKRLNPGS